MIRWIYAKIGEPMWAWSPACPAAPEQAVMFYEAKGPFSEGFPPMTDEDWKRLEKSLNQGRSRC